MATIKDSNNRMIDYIRISLTDHCNMQCVYCRPDGSSCERSEPLSLDQLIVFIKNISELGVRKIKLTGGEPLLRHDFLEVFNAINAIETVEEITLTTNAINLKPYLKHFKDTKLKSINISCDSLKKDKFNAITKTNAFDQVQDAIKACVESGIHTKINTVLIKDLNDDELLDFMMLAKDQPLDVRFIEMMPLGLGNDYQVLKSQVVIDLIETHFKEFEQLGKLGNGPAHYIKIKDFKGRIGLIDAVSHNFCGECNRVRLSSDGLLQLCLAEGVTFDIKPWLKSDDLIKAEFIKALNKKPKQHRFNDKKYQQAMFKIGG